MDSPKWTIGAEWVDRDASRIAVAAVRKAKGELPWRTVLTFTLDPACPVENEMRRIASAVLAKYKSELPAAALNEKFMRERFDPAAVVDAIGELEKV